MGAFDLGFQGYNQRLAQNKQIAEEQRVQQQNSVGAQLLDAINQSSNIKPTMKDENGNVVPNPAYEQAQNDRRTLLQQYTSLYSPEQHASFAQHLHGLIFGHPTPHTQQPALSPNSSPNEPPQPVAAPGQVPASSAPPAPPLHPMAAAPPSHPLHAITGGIKALGDAIKNHAGAFVNPNPQASPQPDPALIAKYYRDPSEVAFERQKELWGERGQNALAVAQERTRALMASLQARPPRFLSQTTIPNLLDQLKTDPDQVIYGPDGNIMAPAQLAEMPAGTIAREFRAGPNVFYALGDQNSKTLNVGGQIYNIPAVGPVTAENSTALGQATSTLPVAATMTETSPGGQQVVKGTSERQRTPTGMVGTQPAGTSQPAGGSPPAPVLKTRTAPSSAVHAPLTSTTASKPRVGTASIGDVAPNIQNMTQANAAKATKAQPAVTALLGLYGDPQLPQVKSMVDFSKLADDPHAQKVLGEAFKLLNQQMGEISDPGIIQTLGTAIGWANFRANAEAQAQQDVGSRMTGEEKAYFNYAIATMADIIGARAATGQSPAHFSVQMMENEVPQIGTSSVTDQQTYLQKLLTIARQVKVGLNAMPDNSRAQKWLLKRENDIIQMSNQGSKKLNPRNANTPQVNGAQPPRPSGVPAGWVHKNGPKGVGWYAPTAK